MNSQAAMMNAATAEKSLSLTEPEALALLEICLIAECDDDLVRSAALEKIGNVCREFIRSEVAAAPHSVQIDDDCLAVTAQGGRRAHARQVLVQFLHRPRRCLAAQ